MTSNPSGGIAPRHPVPAATAMRSIPVPSTSRATPRLRNVKTLQFAALLLGGIGLIVSDTQWSVLPKGFGAIGFLLILASLGPLCWMPRLWIGRIDWTKQGVTYHTGLRRFSVAWSDVAGFRRKSFRVNKGPRQIRIALVRRDGSEVRLDVRLCNGLSPDEIEAVLETQGVGRLTKQKQ